MPGYGAVLRGTIHFSASGVQQDLGENAFTPDYSVFEDYINVHLPRYIKNGLLVLSF